MRIRLVPVRLLILSLLSVFTAAHDLAASPATTQSSRPRPTMGDFMGLNVHTVQFKPELYRPVCRRVRDYHPFDWDVGDDTAHATTFPMAVNHVDWGQMYGAWNKAGFDIDVCIMFDNVAPSAWKDPGRDARDYGESFARYFGPSGKHPLVTSAEVGNEPSKYSEAEYRAIFEGMARGLRTGDPKLKIATCAVMSGKPDQWSKPLSAVAGLEDLYDVLNVHSYAMKEGWPTWRRSYPEDPSIPYLKSIESVIQWRNTRAPGKEVWLTEFGYDSTTKKPDPNGQWKKWIGVSDEQQAQWIVRSFLVLSSMDLDRAYLYFFNDKDEPQLHGSSGITRDFQPKPSYYAMRYLQQTLGDYRFVRSVTRDDGALYCFEYESAKAPGGDRIWIAWAPTADGQAARKHLPVGPKAKIERAERLPLSADAPQPVPCKPANGGVEIEITGSPTFVWLR